jgi:hypothetical protein
MIGPRPEAKGKRNEVGGEPRNFVVFLGPRAFGLESLLRFLFDG